LNILGTFIAPLFTKILYKGTLYEMFFLWNNWCNFWQIILGVFFPKKRISDFLKSQKSKIPHNQVQIYMQHLVNAFLIHGVPRFDSIGKRLFEVGDKYYFENLGIRHALWGYSIENKAKILENAVYNHLLFLGYQVKVGVLGSHEVDFVAEKDGEKLYLQVALFNHDE